MKPKLTIPFLGAIGALLLVSALFLGFIVSTNAYRSGGTGILLPSEVGEAPVITAPDDVGGETTAHLPQITTENVQTVIATLARPDMYTFRANNTLYYAEGASYTIRKQQTVKNGAARTDELSASGAVLQSMVRYKDKVYVWQPSSTTYYAASAGQFSDDSAVMLPTYETVLALPAESILDAGLMNVDYEPCIFVQAEQDGYSIYYYVSAVSGLLIWANFEQDDVQIRSCKVESLSVTDVDDGVFVLPDGTSVFDME